MTVDARVRLGAKTDLQPMSRNKSINVHDPRARTHSQSIASEVKVECHEVVDDPKPR